MEDEMELTKDFLHSIIYFFEKGKAENLDEEEAVNYFRMCKHIEINVAMFKCRGIHISSDVNTGVVSFSSSDVNRSKYDQNQLADKLFIMFCHPCTLSSLLSKALQVYLWLEINI
uniref:Uncharacterized protein n=1 Tax=Lygus hesperus TaxID=30085 RepID=A0A146LCA6_LYGHE